MVNEISDHGSAEQRPACPPIAAPIVALLVGAFALYALTANRGAQWQDSGLHILRIATGQLQHPLGLALVHPLHHWVGRAVAAFGGMEPSFAVTLVSAAAGALAVVNVFGCVVTLTRDRRAGLFAACSLALAHTFWQMATRAEVSTLTAALLTGECWCLASFATSRQRGALWGAFLLNGLGLANHVLALLTTPVLGTIAMLLWKRGEWGRRDVISAAGLWLLGSAPYATLIVGQCLSTGDVAGTLMSALFGHSYADEVLNVSVNGRMLVVSLAFILLNFPNLLLPLAGYGATGGAWARLPLLPRRAYLVELMLYALFAIRYRVVDQHLFFVPTYVLLCILGGIGFSAATAGHSSRTWRRATLVSFSLLALTPAVYASVPALARQLDVLGDVARHKPYRDDYAYLLYPWSMADDSAERVSRHASELAGENGLVIVEDAMAEPAVRYRLLRDRRSGVTVILAPPGSPPISLPQYNADRVVLVPRRTHAPATAPPPDTRWERVGDLYIQSAKSDAP